MEEEYYLVPISNENTYIDNKKISDLYNNKLSKISDIENRIQSLEQNSDLKKHYQEICKKYYEALNIPTHFIIIKRDNEMYELVSALDVYVDDMENISSYQINDAGYIINYFLDTFYKDKVSNLFKRYGFFKKNKELKRRISTH